MMNPLTERDLETLNELVAGYDQGVKYAPNKDRYGIAPLDFGGRNGSHHGKTATKLVTYGLVEHRKRGYDWGESPGAYRGSKVYRPTQEGRKVAAAWHELQRGEIIGNVGSTQKYGRSVPRTGYRPLTDDEIKARRLVCHLEMPS